MEHIWICNKCKKSNSIEYDVCWNCRYGINGETPYQIEEEIDTIQKNLQKQPLLVHNKFSIQSYNFIEAYEETLLEFDYKIGLTITSPGILNPKIKIYQWSEIDKIEYKNYYYTQKRTILNIMYKMLFIHIKKKKYSLKITISKDEELQMITNLEGIKKYTDIFIEENMDEKTKQFWKECKRGSLKTFLFYIFLLVMAPFIMALIDGKS